MGKKEKCKEKMMELFGPATANTVDNMTEENCVQKCKKMVTNFLGPAKAAEFDKI